MSQLQQFRSNMSWILILLCFGLTNSLILANSTEEKLILTQVVISHGDRTILKSFPNDPYKDPAHWPEGMGQLTKLGKQQSFELGKFLRRRYEQFIGIYSPDKVYAVSSNHDRTINTAHLVMAAMFPPQGDQIWNTDLLWQPIAVHSISRKYDNTIYAEMACKRYLKARTAYESSPEIKSFKKQHRELFKYLEEHSGKSVRKLDDFRKICDTLDVEQRANKTLPEWAHRVIDPNDAFENVRNFYMKFITGTTELKRLKSGFLLKEIFDRFKNKTMSLLPDKLMYLYSGHNFTIASLLNSLGIFSIHTPPRASSVLFELYESNGNYYVKIFYKNTTADDLEPLNIPNCGTKCSLDQLYDLYKDILPTDPKTECHVESDT